jgi:molybdopterin/thiamine biosynthesis adenylyltransferase
MPDESSAVARYLRDGIRKIESFLLRECGACRVPDAELPALEGRFLIAGWQLVIETPAGQRRVNICVDQQFPFSVPRFFLVDRPPFMEWPHIEKDGLMCLPNGSVGKYLQPENVAGELLRDAYRLICACESGALENDFRTEFYSYWNRRLSEEGRSVQSLVRTCGPSRLVRVWCGKGFIVAGENEHEVLSWLRKRHGNETEFDLTVGAALLWLERPLLPQEYPTTAADLYRLAASVQNGKNLMAQLGMSPGPFYFLIGAESGNGPCLAAVRTLKPTSTNLRGRKRDRSTDGFRPGKVPASLQATRIFSSEAPATRMKLERIDAEWIHGRGLDPRQRELHAKTLLVFGCGSIGAPIAQQLLMAGVGRLILVDPEDLSWANVGRHPLGADHVGSKKAVALAEVLQKAYPHAHIEAHPMTSHEFLEKHPELVASSDLIICAIADWKAELELNLRQISKEIVSPILYTWTESHACAGHAVLVYSGGPCLQCGFSMSGDSKLRVTKWSKEETERREPACGAVFQPYGPVELLGTILAAAGLALDGLLKKVSSATHRVWAGPEVLLTDAGGAWSPQWIGEDSRRARGAFQEDRLWERDPYCVICGENAHVNHSLSRSDNPRSVSSSQLPS